MGELVAIHSKKRLCGISLKLVTGASFTREHGGFGLRASNPKLFRLLLDKADSEYISIYLSRAREVLYGVRAQEDYWRNAGESVLYGVLGALVHLRDERHEGVTPDWLRGSFAFDRVVALATRCDVPMALRRRLIAYLHTLPGYLGGSMAEAIRHHGFIAMEWMTTIRAMEERA